MKINCKHILLFVLLSFGGCLQNERPAVNKDAWYKHLFIYNLDVKTLKTAMGMAKAILRGLPENFLICNRSV
jgi:hypothetical protein